ncbi:MAG: hypothetical protein RL556_362 [Actinomycetota bacterium]|jgi:predicted GNAT family acetyltransferase
MEPHVSLNEQLHRYELWLGEDLIGFSDYEQMLNEQRLVHVEVNPEHQGKNYAGVLMQGSIDDIRAKGKSKIVPVCSYAVMWMKRHPETHDLLAIDIDDAVAACRIRKFN